VSSRATGFSKSLRLNTAAEYSRVFDSASRSKDNSFIVLARANSKSVARLGLAVSKKHLRLAVQRNRVKRLIRESFREHQSALTGIDIIVLTQRNTLLKSTGELRESINAHWGKIKECTKF
jgi:ribonuclease P protein component